jgi:predicted negative regulator of RcsB-dependent stress response
MASEVTETPTIYKLWAWFETNKRQAGWGAAALVAIGLVAGFVLWRQAAKQEAAGEAFSKVFVPMALAGGPRGENPEAYLKVAADHPNSQAAIRAVLFAAGGFFVEGKFAEAQTQFTRLAHELRENPLQGEALLGIAACLDAQGKTNEAVTAYRDLVDHHPTDVVYPQAKFALANLYLAQGKPDDARRAFEELVTKDPYGSLGAEAGMKLEELKLNHPELFQPPPAPVVTPTAVPSTSSPPSVVAPTGGPVVVPKTTQP